MSTQRYIDTSFWDDSWVQELDPSEKLMYIYLLTNPLTNIAGVMELTVKRICFDTGFNSDTVGHILNKFEKAKKVYKYNNYIIIRNFPKHQQLENEKILKGIALILSKLPDDVLAYLEEIGYQLDIKNTFDTLCIPYTYPSNYLKEYNLNNNLNLNKAENQKSNQSSKQKKESLKNREPENDYERVEKVYLEIWSTLYQQNKVQTSEPILSTKTWVKIRALEKGLFAKGIKPETIQSALHTAERDDFVIKNGYALDLILSNGVINRLINGSIKAQKSYQDTYTSEEYKNMSDNLDVEIF